MAHALGGGVVGVVRPALHLFGGLLCTIDLRNDNIFKEIYYGLDCLFRGGARILRVMKIATLAQIESSQAQSSSDPSCEDHTAEMRYSIGSMRSTPSVQPNKAWRSCG